MGSFRAGRVFGQTDDSTFQSPTVYDVTPAGLGFNSISLGDFDGDGKADVASGLAGTLNILLGNGNGPPSSNPYPMAEWKRHGRSRRLQPRRQGPILPCHMGVIGICACSAAEGHAFQIAAQPVNSMGGKYNGANRGADSGLE